MCGFGGGGGDGFAVVEVAMILVKFGVYGSDLGGLDKIWGRLGS